MNKQQDHSGENFEHPVRAGIYSTIDDAANAVETLIQKGFAHDTISVVCKQPKQREYFARYLSDQAAASKSEDSNNPLGTAVKVGLGVGGVAALVELVSIGAATAFVIGSLAGVAALGSLAALLIGQGISNETVRFYEQSVQAGDILVAVEIRGDDQESRIAMADQALRDAGAKPLPLSQA